MCTADNTLPVCVLDDEKAGNANNQVRLGGKVSLDLFQIWAIAGERSPGGDHIFFF